MQLELQGLFCNTLQGDALFSFPLDTYPEVYNNVTYCLKDFIQS